MLNTGEPANTRMRVYVGDKGYPCKVFEYLPEELFDLCLKAANCKSAGFRHGGFLACTNTLTPTGSKKRTCEADHDRATPTVIQ